MYVIYESAENGAGNNLAKMLSRIDLRELKMLQICNFCFIEIIAKLLGLVWEA